MLDYLGHRCWLEYILIQLWKHQQIYGSSDKQSRSIILSLQWLFTHIQTTKTEQNTAAYNSRLTTSDMEKYNSKIQDWWLQLMVIQINPNKPEMSVEQIWHCPHTKIFFPGAALKETITNWYGNCSAHDWKALQQELYTIVYHWIFASHPAGHQRVQNQI